MQGKMGDDAGLPDPKSVALTLARCACNNHTICDDELRPIGEYQLAWPCIGLEMRLVAFTGIV